MEGNTRSFKIHLLASLKREERERVVEVRNETGKRREKSEKWPRMSCLGASLGAHW